MKMIDFLKDEVRSGFYVPTAIKQVWACQLKVLSEIDRICKKYNITYFAEWGTLLGAVRHGGYIPWDDDIDISMKRDDYERFRQVVDNELPEEFAIHDYERHEGHWLFLSRVVNVNHICFDMEHLNNNYNFPFIAAVDIFVLDYLYKNEEEEKTRCNEVKYLIAVADGISSGKFDEQVISIEINKIQNQYGVKFHINGYDGKERRTLAVSLYRLAEQQMARVPKEAADTMGQIFPHILKGKKGLPKFLYEKAIRLPFEYCDIPVPQGYHKVLSSRFEDYFRVVKACGAHEYPFFEKQKDALLEVLDFEYPEFRFDKSMFRHDELVDKIMEQNIANNYSITYPEGSLKAMVCECFAEIKAIILNLSCMNNIQDYNFVLDSLVQCQQLAVDMGNLLENVKGEDNPYVKSVVNKLEQFCEALYVVYQQVTDIASMDKVYTVNDVVSVLSKKIEQLQSVIYDSILKRKTVLFVAVGGRFWEFFYSIYESYVMDNDVDVQVVAVPVLYKDSLGQVKMTKEQIEESVHRDEYPKSIRVMEWETYNMQLAHPEVIYFQDPYDGENPCLTVPPEFYSKNMQKFCNRLVYVPAYKVDEFGANDSTDLYNLKHYVTAPGLMYADEIYVQSENIKNQWINKLVDFAGEETKEIWQKRLVVSKIYTASYDCQVEECKANIEGDNSKQLVCIGINEIVEHKNVFFESLNKMLDEIKESKNSRDIHICLYPETENQWEIVETDTLSKLKKMLAAWKVVEIGKNPIIKLLEYDSYYGSPTPYFYEMKRAGKKAEIMNII